MSKGILHLTCGTKIYHISYLCIGTDYDSDNYSLFLICRVVLIPGIHNKVLPYQL